ncbi:hypothetical protein DS2_09237 [Catenovulum agarivorans DS-2]|uniref:BLUF domain-containing protein n=1 Tax=Catenovulum agarivorans DS-2 TaxID=1328313 RepID=W7QQE1_9ALTE|nr:BLUF domain-containing protein [Catenovulum agarivorans]EWH10118.1 hypothetical protein DS2_09237 [Catenovulum agarivorans DS-2]
MVNLVRLIYHSKATTQLSAAELAQLQQQAIQFNKDNDITGVLVYDEKNHSRSQIRWFLPANV